ncbi:DMT family transporter [Conexibacter sp. DBS9H8]|uniref:DMT family transporter n=1 Tax=Conexibacter sp. DBS9H8 TaxID=2937801 RepID=UPI00200DD98D|nr:DMT family transporter [Conexibacter sp. DBS9H8]
MPRRALVLFALLGIIWGIPYLLIKVAVTELSPVMLVFARTGLAALIMVPLAAQRGELRPALRRWRPLVAYTVCELVVPWYLLSSAEERLPSSTTALLIAAAPLVGVGVGVLLGRAEPLSGLNRIGIAVGMVGVAALVGFDVHASDLGAVGEVAVVTVGYATGPAILARWLSEAPAIGVVALSMAGTALLYLPAVLITGAWPAHAPSGTTVAAVLTLAVLCSAGAFVMLAALVAEIGPVRATAITYINPAVAVVAGVVFLHEPLTVTMIVGLALVLGGSWLLTRRRGTRRAGPPGPLGTPEVAPALATQTDPSAERRPRERRLGPPSRASVRPSSASTPANTPTATVSGAREPVPGPSSSTTGIASA